MVFGSYILLLPAIIDTLILCCLPASTVNAKNAVDCRIHDCYKGSYSPRCTKRLELAAQSPSRTMLVCVVPILFEISVLVAQIQITGTVESLNFGLKLLFWLWFAFHLLCVYWFSGQSLPLEVSLKRPSSLSIISCHQCT